MKIAILGAAAPENPLFRAFSNLGWEVFAEPEIDGMHGDLFFCGDGKEYLPAMKALIAEIGLRPVFIGGLEYSPIIDSLARLYFALALGQNHWRHLGFKMLKTGPDHL